MLKKILSLFLVVLLVNFQKVSVVKATSDMLIEPMFDNVESFSSSTLVTVEKDGKKGIVNYRGEVVIGCGEYYHVYPSDNTVMAWDAAPIIGDTAEIVYTYYGEQPRKLFDDEYVSPEELGIDMSKYDPYYESYYSDGLCAVVDKETGMLGYIDEDGREVIPCKFYANNEANFYHGYARVFSCEYYTGWGDGSEEQVYCGMIDKNGNLVVGYQYAFINKVSSNDLWQCYSYNESGDSVFNELRRGAELIVSGYDEMRPFSNAIKHDYDKYWVKRDGLWGLLKIPDEEASISFINDNFVKNGDVITGETTVCCSVLEDTTANLIIAFFASDHSMQSIYIKNVNLTKGNNIIHINDMEIKCNKDVACYKVFLWSDMKSSIPLTNDISIELTVLETVHSLEAGGFHSMMLDVSGTLYSWGANYLAQLGTGDMNDYETPQKIMENVRSISTGRAHNAVVKKDGSLWMFGWNEHSQSAGGDELYVTSPKKIMDGIVHCNAGWTTSAAINKDNELYIWGELTYPLGVGYQYEDEIWGTTYRCDVPTKIFEDVAKIQCGRDHFICLKTDGTVWTWGGNYDGQLGDGTYSDRATPVKIMEGVVDIFSSPTARNSLALKKDGSLWAWGNNTYNQLNDQTIKNSSNSPVKIFDEVQTVSVDYMGFYIIKRDNSLWEAGFNNDTIVKKRENVKKACIGNMVRSYIIDMDGKAYEENEEFSELFFDKSLIN